MSMAMSPPWGSSPNYYPTLAEAYDALKDLLEGVTRFPGAIVSHQCVVAVMPDGKEAKIHTHEHEKPLGYRAYIGYAT